MPSDEELRRVAEDMRALARSLARDFWHATDAAARSGRPPVDAVRQSLREMAAEARRSAYPYRGHRHGRRSAPPTWSRGRWSGPVPGSPAAWWGPAPGPAGPPAPGTADPPVPPPAGPAGAGPDRRRGPDHARGQRCWSGRAGLPPVRRRWDATTVAGTLAVLFGGAWLLGGVGAVHIPAEAVVAVGLMLLGAAVMVTARTDWSLSRRSWPVWLGALLLVVLAATSATFGVEGSLRHVSFGTMRETARPPATVYGGFGDLTVDARSLHPGQRVTVESVAGNTVIEPPAAPVFVDVRLLGGQICVAGQDVSDGAGARVQQLVSSPGAGAAPAGPSLARSQVVEIDVHQMAGKVQIGGQRCTR